MSRTLRRLMNVLVTTTVLIVWTGIPSRVAAAQQTAVLKVTRTIQIDAVGNAAVHLTLTAPTNVYTLIKTRTPNVAVLVRQLGAGRHWAIVENVAGQFDDSKSAVDIRYTQRGMARIAQGDEWTVAFEKGASIDLVDTFGSTAIYNMATNSDLGLVSTIVRVVAPERSTNVRHDSAANAFVYRLDPKAADGGRSEATFAVDHKDSIMSCLAKCYSNEQFTFIWAARAKLQNTGNTTLSDYRVRFRIAGLSSWSGWCRTAKVFPGQTVVDPFYPVFELDKLNDTNGTRPAMLEIEYQYRRPNGQTVTETDARPLQILGRNETIFSGLASTEMLTFEDRYEYLPAVLASFTTPNDPVIQELAGRVSGRAGGAASSYRNEDALKYLRALYEFMVENHIAYQSPPSYVDGARVGQHIKYGRDVLRNHAGTCVDLAILWASACEAVGLQPILVLVPGHCFPAVHLPNGQIIAIEATVIGKVDFDKAVEIGVKEYNEARQGQSFVIDVLALRKAGVVCLDLPSVPHNFLTDLGYRFEPTAKVRTDAQTEGNGRKQEQTNATPDNDQANSPLVGQWGFSGQVPSGQAQIGISLRGDSGMAFYANMRSANGEAKEFKSVGTWKVDGDCLAIADKSGTNRFQFSLQNGKLAIYFPKLNATVTFVRLQG